MSSTIKFQNITHQNWFIAIPHQASIQFNVFPIPDAQSSKIQKFSQTVLFRGNAHPQLAFLQNLQDYLTFLQAGLVSVSDDDPSLLVWTWSIEGGSFRKSMIYRMCLKKQNLSEVDELKYQNMILKRKLSEYQQRSTGQDLNRKKKQIRNDGMIIKIEEPRHINDQVSSTIPAENTKDLNDVEEQLPDQSKSKMSDKQMKVSGKTIKKEKRKDEANKNLVEDFPIEQKRRGRRKKVQVNPITLKQQNEQNLVKVTFDNGDYYYGQLKNDLYHGHGLYYSKINGVFQGQWKNGKANGYGVSKDPLGNQHSGFFVNDKRNGKGVDIYTNGEKYTGDFQMDAKSGFGKYIYVNGDSYEGEWKNDMYHGKGKQIYADGTYFEGIWMNDEKEGEGIFTNRQGKKMKQVWQSGKLISEIENKEN